MVGEEVALSVYFDRLLYLIIVASFVSMTPRIVIADELTPQLVVETQADSGAITESVNRWLGQGFQERNVNISHQCSDEAFCRRIYLDLAGRIPTSAEFENWMQSSRDRGLLIDRVLESDDFVLHFADLFDALLMGRASEKKYHERQQSQWRAYLEQAIRDNRSWEEVVEEILLARPEAPEQKGLVWFLYERNNDFQKIAESIAPSIFGVRIECAQCHDHMMADEIKQAHYWGLVAFFNRGKNSDSNGTLKVDESATGGFSEFADLSGESTPNYLTFLEAETVSEVRPDGKEEQEDSDDLYQPNGSPLFNRVPKFSRREQFVKQVVRDHPRLALAFVNRIWAILMGRGIVHPFDEMDSMHRPSHPELLEWLAEDTRQNHYDLKRLVRGIVRSQAYQQTSVRRAGLEDPASFAWYLERPLTGEQLARSVMVALRGSADTDVVGAFRQQFPEVLPET
ncbi:MAG: DUF1549 domain-containing protein, partial [Planctomycetota bacterium]|nr:DUF1549 domain-containing protein [Planctomycetota bacterium]